MDAPKTKDNNILSDDLEKLMDEFDKNLEDPGEKNVGKADKEEVGVGKNEGNKVLWEIRAENKGDYFSDKNDDPYALNNKDCEVNEEKGNIALAEEKEIQPKEEPGPNEFNTNFNNDFNINNNNLIQQQQQGNFYANNNNPFKEEDNLKGDKKADEVDFPDFNEVSMNSNPNQNHNFNNGNFNNFNNTACSPHGNNYNPYADNPMGNMNFANTGCEPRTKGNVNMFYNPYEDDPRKLYFNQNQTNQRNYPPHPQHQQLPPKKPTPSNPNPPNNNHAATIKNILNTVETIIKTGTNNYKNYNVLEAVHNFEKVCASLQTLKSTILSKMQDCSNFLGYIDNKYNDAKRLLVLVKLNKYELIPKKFSVQPYNQSVSLQDYLKNFCLVKPFITFDDIYEVGSKNNQGEQMVRQKLPDLFNRGQRTGFKTLLLIGPKGSGKTLAVHALANYIGGWVIEIEGEEYLKIPYFVSELVKLTRAVLTKPVVVYVKDINRCQNAVKEIIYLSDSICGLKNKTLFICSCSVTPNVLNPMLQKKFYFTHYIRPVQNINKGELLRFICNRTGVNLNSSGIEMHNIISQNLAHYSNSDIFKLVKNAYDNLKQDSNGNLNCISAGINFDYLKRAADEISPSLSDKDVVDFYLQ